MLMYGPGLVCISCQGEYAKAGELYERVRTKLNVAQPPPALTTSYHAEYFEANAAVGVKVIEPPEVPDVRSAYL